MKKVKRTMERSMSSSRHNPQASQPQPIPSNPSQSTSTSSKSLFGSKDGVKRKPVPSSSNASSPASYQNSSLFSESIHHPSTVTSSANSIAPSSTSISTALPRDLDQYPRGYSPQNPSNPAYVNFPPVIAEPGLPSPRGHRSQASESLVNDSAKIKRVPVNQGLQRAKSLHPTGKAHPLDNIDDEPTGDPAMIAKRPRSPGPNKLTSFFGWKTSPTPVAEVSPGSVSDYSPGPSPTSPSPNSMGPSRTPPKAIDTSKANAAMNGSFPTDTGFPVPPTNGHNYTSSLQIDDLEDEIREISSELAGSIRREMELEDLVERLQLEAQQGPDLNGRRTSDYFSDSGSGSIRYPGSDTGFSKADDLAKQKRLSEQEKAQYKMSLSQKLSNERERRKALESHVSQINERMQSMDNERAISSDVANRVRDLESSVEDYRRRLHEEKRAKENFEDMLNAMKGQIAQFRDERDNLRDEVVPQLNTRLEGLEAETAKTQELTYDNTRMAQELQSLRNENTTLMNARRLQLEMQQNSTRFNAIAEEGSPASPEGLGLGLMRSASTRGGGLGRSGSLKRSNSISSKEREFNERVKDIEMQRDALHKALKLLLDRQSYQKREHEKEIKLMELERDRALQNQSPRRMGYEKEVTGLKYEIDSLRRRADDAIQQKWQCEKGLGGLKHDLDRAEHETASLRHLLQENDILVPEKTTPRAGASLEDGAAATSDSLEKAYRELQKSQALSISRLREMHGQIPSGAEDAETKATMEKLLRSMSNAESERVLAQKQASLLRAEAQSLQEAEVFHSEENDKLSEQLRAAANRIETLSQSVRSQLEGNRNLRQRLAEAVNRGEENQKTSTTRITSMQGRLKDLEDKLVTAQSQSEDIYAQHEEEVRNLKEAHNAHLQRLRTSGLKLRTASTYGSPRLSQSPAMSPIFQSRSPRLDKTTSGVGKSLDEALRTQYLEKKVTELEGALGDADKEMEEVVSKMNLAQIEVMELQSARDDAMRQTRKLQSDMEAERQKVESLTKTSFFKR